MVITLINKEIPIWTEEEAFTGRSQIGMDAVIPDSREDADRVVWTQGLLLLKGKEASAHCLTVSGELNVSVLYLTESGALDTLRLKKEYEISFELGEPEPDALPQISSRLVSLEAKLMNPRKLSVSADVLTVLQPFSRDKLSLDASLPEDVGASLHLLRNQKEILVLKNVREKTFTVREQLKPQSDSPFPRSIAGESLALINFETETLGTRSIIKGEAELRIWGLDETGVPVFSRFRLPFSQLIETGEENPDRILASGEPGSVYLDWIEDGGGERSIEAEIHGVLQFRCYGREVPSYVSDAYSTRMPSSTIGEKRMFMSSLERNTALISGEESFPMPDDAAEILCSEANLGLLESDREQVSVSLTADLLYRSTDGHIGSARRSIRLRGEPLAAGGSVQSVRLRSCEAVLENGKLRLHGEAELLLEQRCFEQLETVSAVELQEDLAWDPAGMPAVSLVFPHGESLWELAKEYHSSPESIEACNPDGGEMLLIPVE